MTTATRAAAFAAGFAAEDFAAQVHAAVVTTETTTPAAFVGRQVFFDLQRNRRGLVIASVDGVAFAATAVGIADVLLVRKACTIGTADVFRRVKLNVVCLFRMTDFAIGFLAGFLIGAIRRVADKTFRVAGDRQRRRFGGVGFVAEIARGFLPVRQIVADV